MGDSEDDRIEQIRAQLEEWNMGLDELQATVERAEAERKSQLQERLEALRADFERAQDQFNDLPREGEAKWEQFRSGMEEGRRLLDEALKEVGSNSPS